MSGRDDFAVPAVPIELGARLWWDPGYGVTTLSAKVTSWVDRILSQDALQNTDVRRPTYQAVNPNLHGNPGLDFVQADTNYLSCGKAPSGLAMAGPWTMAAEFRAASGAASSGVITSMFSPGQNAWAQLLALTSGRLRISSRSDVPDGVTADTLHGAYMQQWALATFNTVSRTVSVGSEVDGPAFEARPSQAFTGDDLWIGSYATGAPFDGTIGHVVWFDRALSPVDRARLEAWFESIMQPEPVRLQAAHWWDPDYGVTTLSGRVSSWVDRIGALDAAQGIETRRPTYEASAARLDGSAGITCDDANPDVLQAVSVPETLGDSAHAVAGEYAASNASDGTVSAVASGVAWSAMQTQPSVSSLRFYQRNAASSSVGVSAPHDPGDYAHQAGYLADDLTDLDVVTGRASNTGTSRARPLSADNIMIGSGSVSNTNPMDGTIGHVVWFARALEIGARRVLRKWLDKLVGDTAWAPDGYAALFETAAPSAIALDESESPDAVTSWLDSTGTYYAVPGIANARPSMGVALGGFNTIYHAYGDAFRIDDAALSLLASGLSWSFTTLFVPDSFASNMHLLSCADATDITMMVRVHSNQTLRFYLSDLTATAGKALFSVGTFPASGPMRAQVSYDASTQTAYVRAEGNPEESAVLSPDPFAVKYGGLFGTVDETGEMSALHRTLIGAEAGAIIYPSALDVAGRAAVWDAYGTRFGL
jgi:hypothetical protein